MKKIVLLSLMVCLIACFGACTKRGKLLNNAMILQIEPAEYFTIGVGDVYPLRAIVKNAKKEDVNEPVKWSVSPAELGSFSSVNSKNTEFTAETSGDGTITLSCQGMVVTVNVTVS